VIVAQAGRSGAVTIATNMAGRGTDIKLGGDPAGLASQKLHGQGLNPAEVEPSVYEQALEQARIECDEDHVRVVGAGGLHIIGTERHDARRIDNQLRGRSGRQGDPGSSRFFLSLEDALLKRFASDRVTSLMERMGLEGDVAIESRMVSKTVENAQTRVEGHNFDIRKRVVEYDDVINKQRERIYAERDKVLHNEDLGETVLSFVEQEIEGAVEAHLGEVVADWDLDGLVESMKGLGLQAPDLEPEALAELRDREAITARLVDLAAEQLEQREATFGDETWSLVEKAVLLRAIDSLWVDHLTELEDFRRGVGLRGYGGTDPLVEFKREAFKLYDELRGFIRHQVAATIFRVSIQRRTVAPEEPTAMPELTSEQLAMLRAAADGGSAPGEARGQAAAAIASGGSVTSSSGALATAELSALPPSPLAATGLPSGAAASRPMRLQRGDETVGSAGPRDGSAEAARLGRNDPCWCGSGKKFKRCHGS
jgi:preprotein translocase subunit SecA